MERKELRLVFFTLAILMATQPGAIAFANFDAPYGFYKDLSTWILSYLGGAVLLFVYGVITRGGISGKFLGFYGMHILVLLLITYFMIVGEVNPSLSILNLPPLIFLGLFLSILLFIPSVFSPPYYSYDLPLLLAQIGLWIWAFWMLLKLRKFEEEEKFFTIYRIFLGLMLFSIFFGVLKLIEVFR
ncbi:hypothetical protein K1720_00875 [Thermococcus argininiproducens]|uniref:Uncharacterized protein n=1 Tax=Thermococcus argininiproducens TaxID=2866384 RepID=A0A9E7SDI5_9EURY|nr:hypothetical protein [Thermococcus argininiproducens]USH00073.1 hypothetical protein K1720_00875 [Thermococcus argininiproducens]